METKLRTVHQLGKFTKAVLLQPCMTTVIRENNS